MSEPMLTMTLDDDYPEIREQVAKLCENFPGDSLIGEEGEGFRYILEGTNAERCLTASEAIGNGKYFVEKAVAYANQRIVFGRPVGQN